VKKIIFVINNLETGGVQKSLLNLLKEIHNKYDITLLTFFGNEDFEKELPENIKVIETHSSFRQLGMSAKQAKRNMFLYVERAFYIILTKLFGRSAAMKLMSFGKIKYKGYDTAVSFIHEAPQKVLYGGCNEFVLKMIEAKKKITWLHCDFGLSGANNSKSKDIYEKFDTIVACSDGCKQAFLACLPELADKTVSVRNCNDYDQIRRLAGDGIQYDREHFNVVTVARLSEEKGLCRALVAISECVKRGCKVKYHIVGSGSQELLLRKKAEELNIKDIVNFYGNQTNPYPYMKNADLFMLTSYHEAAPMVFDEAACLGVPVLATQTTSTQEMIVQSGCGLVCENSQKGINEALLSLALNREKIIEIRAHISKSHFENDASVNRLISIL